MNLEALLALYKLTVSAIQVTTRTAADLARQVKAYFPDFNAFIRGYRQANPQVTYQGAIQAYRIGKFFNQEAAALTRLDPMATIDTRLATTSYAPQSEIDQNGKFRAHVFFDIEDPKTGEVEVWDTWYYFDRLSSIEEIQAKALLRLVASLQGPSKERIQGQMQAALATATIGQFVRFEASGL